MAAERGRRDRIEISSEVSEDAWSALRAHAEESDGGMADLLGEAIAEFLERRRARPGVLRRLDDSVRDNRELGRLLADRADREPAVDTGAGGGGDAVGAATPLEVLTRDELLTIHERMLAEFGGRGGVRDVDVLSTVLAEALRAVRAAGPERLETMAADLLVGLLTRHPFVDANRRVAFFATDVFCRLNGWRVEATSRAIYEFLVETLEPDDPDRRRVIAWLQEVLGPAA